MARMTKFNAKCIMQLNAIRDVGGVAQLPVAKLIAARAAELAPKRTGYMASKIRARKTEALGATVEANAPYSGFVEFGTRHMAARPFLRPAIDEKTREILEAERQALQMEIALRIHR